MQPLGEIMDCYNVGEIEQLNQKQHGHDTPHGGGRNWATIFTHDVSVNINQEFE